jgi:hypothetical protein
VRRLAAALAVIPIFIGSVKAAASLPHSKGFASNKKHATLAEMAALRPSRLHFHAPAGALQHIRNFGNSLVEVCRQFLNRAVWTDGDDVHFAAHQCFVFSPVPDLLAESDAVFRCALHGRHYFNPVAQRGGPAEFDADLVDNQPAIRPRDFIHRHAERFEKLAPAALEIAKIIGIIYDALRIGIFKVNSEFQHMIIRLHMPGFYIIPDGDVKNNAGGRENSYTY